MPNSGKAAIPYYGQNSTSEMVARLASVIEPNRLWLQYVESWPDRIIRP